MARIRLLERSGRTARAHNDYIINKRLKRQVSIHGSGAAPGKGWGTPPELEIINISC